MVTCQAGTLVGRQGVKRSRLRRRRAQKSAQGVHVEGCNHPPRVFTGLTLAWGYGGKVLEVSLLEENVRGQIGLVAIRGSHWSGRRN
jgi:hypothetical protein